jgi:hypothetical protein
MTKEDNWYKEWEHMHKLQERGRKEAWVNKCVYNVIIQLRARGL